MPRDARGDPTEASPRLAFVDGLRGLAASYVVLHHAALMVPPAGLAGPSTIARFFLRHGHYAVSLFVILSGYCLMLRASEESDGRLPGGIPAYFWRRARRILPPYYAALALSWSLIAAVPTLGRPALTPWDRALPAFGPGAIASHLLLVQNLDARWIFRVGPHFWSLATEWQTFLLFPALLATWRRRGMAWALALALALGAAAAALSIGLDLPVLRKLCPWYAGLFTMGMAGAVVSGESRPRGLASRGPRRDWPALVAGALATALALAMLRSTGDDYVMAGDLLIGAAMVGLVVRCARIKAREAEGRTPSRSPALRLLESRGLVALGVRSYSLYLIHYPLLALANLMLRDRGWGPDGRLAALILVASPLCVPAAGLFRQIVERPAPPIRRPGTGRERPPSALRPNRERDLIESR